MTVKRSRDRVGASDIYVNGRLGTVCPFGLEAANPDWYCENFASYAWISELGQASLLHSKDPLTSLLYSTVCFVWLADVADSCSAEMCFWYQFRERIINALITAYGERGFERAHSGRLTAFLGNQMPYSSRKSLAHPERQLL